MKDINIHEWKHNIRMMTGSVENKVWDTLLYWVRLMQGMMQSAWDMSCNRADMRVGDCGDVESSV